MTNNHYSLPAVRDTLPGHEFVADNFFTFLLSDPLLAYIYPLPSSLNCKGTVSAVRYCYYYNFNDEVGNELPVFTLLTLKRIESSLNFTITDAIGVFSTPSFQICTRRYCCDSSRLIPTDRFGLPAPNFAFGIVPSFQVLLLGYDEDVYPEYLVEHYTAPRD